jgi:hypothetical protein
VAYIRSNLDAGELWRRNQLAKSLLGSQRVKTRAESEALMALDGATIQQITDSRKEEKPHVVQGR